MANAISVESLLSTKSYTNPYQNFIDVVIDEVYERTGENPYNTPFIMQDYEGEYTVDGKDYEVRSCRTDFCACGLWHLAEKPPFEFYMFFDLETLPDTTVDSYQKSRKMYLI